ncbi:MAG: hypothetical protein JXA21_27560 [Anaerolineae bacterium]|nr:hypothetical protein [Anaerolineae bacterium]
MSEEKTKPAEGIAGLIQRLAKATGLPEDLAQSVVETAVETIKTQRPDMADKVDTAMANEETTRKMSDLVEKLARKVPRPPDSDNE